ncbi:unnamed protein product [Zymoseptoria tritici ST99CH_1E4]|uniref:SMP-30/Gluconolactonase/LRE-like region domain-containing protein n=1 Tax=Zymoseptoria tritici ST99CH_1E4 TaxID=1276532 RepID=A0A2H1FN75_ZYMTR|nr:unnamed protein product [Zymoseptoria tritici ST99CH_1E4]
MNLSTKFGIVFAIFAAALYQGFLKTTLFTTVGLGRVVQPISDFPSYQCRRIHDPRLEACEDMWLSEETRQLFLACSSSASRKEWMPNVGRLNASGRSLNDAIIAMDIDKPKGDSFSYQTLKTPGFGGVNGDGRLHLVGFTARDVKPKDGDKHTTEFYLVNAKPFVDSETGALLDNAKVGPNMTIESFVMQQGSTELKHVKTFHDQHITTPNNIAIDHVDGQPAFFFTNDHGTATHGIKHSLAPLIAEGNIGYCSGTTCRVLSSSWKFPNGLLRGRDDRLYVPSAWVGGIKVFKVNVDRSLEQVSYIDIDYPLDNLSQDVNGDIWAAGIPKALKIFAAFDDPLHVVSPATIFRIRRGLDGWEVKKVLEDANGEMLPGATTAIHDVKTGRIFVSGVTAPFITVCDPAKRK